MAGEFLRQFGAHPQAAEARDGAVYKILYERNNLRGAHLDYVVGWLQEMQARLDAARAAWDAANPPAGTRIPLPQGGYRVAGRPDPRVERQLRGRQKRLDAYRARLATLVPNLPDRLAHPTIGGGGGSPLEGPVDFVPGPDPVPAASSGTRRIPWKLVLGLLALWVVLR